MSPIVSPNVLCLLTHTVNADVSDHIVSVLSLTVRTRYLPAATAIGLVVERMNWPVMLKAYLLSSIGPSLYITLDGRGQ